MDSTMDDRASPLFVPQGTPTPQANEPEVKEEQSPSPPRPRHPVPPPIAPQRRFSPLLSRAERTRRTAATEPPNHDIARAAIQAGRLQLQAAVTLATGNAPMNNNGARTADNGPPNEALALETGSRDLKAALQLANLAAMHSTVAENALQGPAPTQPVARNDAAPPVPQRAPQATAPPIPLDLVRSAHHHLDALTAELRKLENEACDREEDLTVLLDQAREIRTSAIQDRRNGLVVIRDRQRRLDELEAKLRGGEMVDEEEMLELLRPLKLVEMDD